MCSIQLSTDMNSKGRPRGIKELKSRRGRHGRGNFSGWAKLVIEAGRAHGRSDAEIQQWIKIYAKKRKIPRGTVGDVLSRNGVYIRRPYRIRATSRAALHQKNTIPPKIRFLGNEISEGLKKWQLSILRTLQEAKEQGEDVQQAKREIMGPIKRDWDSFAFSKIMSLEEFIKRMVPELLEIA
jgi:hypothetical protein